MIWPVTKLAVSDARKIAAPMSSSVSPHPPSGVLLTGQSENAGFFVKAAEASLSEERIRGVSQSLERRTPS
jgi:hypothetical protein